MRNKHRPKPRDDLLEIWQVCWPQRGPLFLTDECVDVESKEEVKKLWKFEKISKLIVFRGCIQKKLSW
jgi:hypothetical protein